MDNDDYEITVNIGNNKTKNKLMTFPKFDVKESLKVDSHHNNTLGIFHIIGKRGSGKTVLIKNLIINLMTLNKIKNIIFNNNRTQYTDIIENVENIERALIFAIPS